MAKIPRPLLFAALAAVACRSRLEPQQSLTATPAAMRFRMVQGGPICPPQKLSITAPGAAVKWAIESPETEPWLLVSQKAGSTPATVEIGMVAWRAATQVPGQYKSAITIRAPGGSETRVPVEWAVLPRSAGPAFTYLSGPHHCEQAPGYADAAFCTSPGQKPWGDFAPPRPGGTYEDPNFGAKITVLAEQREAYVHAYSTPSAVSAGNKYVLVFDKTGNTGPHVLSAATGRPLHRNVEANFSAMWDAHDSEIYYFLAGTAVKKYDLRKHKTSVVVDYARDGHGFTAIRNGGTGDTTRDNWISFWAKDQKQVCALDLNTVKTYCGSLAPLPGPPIPFAEIDYSLTTAIDRATGKRYVLLMTDPAMAVFSVDTSRGTLRFEFRGPENPEGTGNHDGICDPGESCMGAPHADVFESSDGIQYLVTGSDTQSPCERALATYQISKGTRMRDPVELGGGKKTIFTLARCGDVWTDNHFGCSKQAPVCAITTEQLPRRDPQDRRPPPRAPHVSEVILMRDNGAEIRRLASTRSVAYSTEAAESYWTSSRACLSPDGSFAVAGSNFGVPDAQWIIRIDTGAGAGQRSEGTVR